MFYPQGTRNESAAVSYAIALCQLDRLAKRMSYDSFDEVDRNYLLMNRARTFTGFCYGVKLYRQRCNKSKRGRKHVKTTPSLYYGIRSPLFSKVDGIMYCLRNVSI